MPVSRGTGSRGTRDHLAVYPVGGWWKENVKHQKSDEGVHYTLLVSVEAPDAEVDLYATIATEIGLPVEVET